MLVEKYIAIDRNTSLTNELIKTIFTINAPTGTGKTITYVLAALVMLKLHINE